MEPRVFRWDTEDHTRTIIHVDIDCFYAQVEMVKNPNLVNVPLGVQQKNIVVTSNYIARQFGVNKCMLVTEALQVCPNLVLVNGEDLHDYRQISYRVTAHLQKYSTAVERLGLDENYIDVSDLVQSRLGLATCDVKPIGNVFGQTNEICQCGCNFRLAIGSMIAQEIRESLREELQLTCCAGVAHNKLLAKLVGATHKPNQQTVLMPNNAFELMSSLKSVGDITGIGRILGETLQNANIKTVAHLQNISYEELKKVVGVEKADLLQNLSFGIDKSSVKATGKPQSIGLEDSCKTITAIGEVKDKLTHLLQRLMVLISEDGRIPRTLKLTVRKYDNIQKVNHRETKQCNISPMLFLLKDNKVALPDKSEQQVMANIMNLVNKIVDINKPYHITLLGLSVTKFIERMNGKSSITSFLRKGVEVHSLTNIENKSDSSMDCSPARGDVLTDGSESDLEPSPKKSKQFSSIISRRKCFKNNCPSPSKLKVAGLNLSDDKEKPSISTENRSVPCPPNADTDVFKELPKEIQQELWDQYSREKERANAVQQQHNAKPKVNTLFNYFVKNC